MRMRESGMIKRRINREIANLKIMEGVVRAGLPEWSKGGDLRSPMRRHAWVQTPQPAIRAMNSPLALLMDLVIHQTLLATHFENLSNSLK